MGCTGSKQARRDRRRSPAAQPLPRSYSMPIHHPALRKGDSCHVVALTSTTLGSLAGDNSAVHGGAGEDDDVEPMMKSIADDRSRREKEVDLVVKAKAWSEMIERKIPSPPPPPRAAAVPRTPTRTPPNEPEMINTWELMAGLEDFSPLHRHVSGGVDRSFSFHALPFHDREPTAPAPAPARLSTPVGSMWMEVGGNNESIVSDFDPEIISSFRKALENLSPKHPFFFQSPEQQDNHQMLDDVPKEIHQMFDDVPKEIDDVPKEIHQMFDDVPKEIHQVFDDVPRENKQDDKELFDDVPKGESEKHKVFDDVPREENHKVFDDVPREESENHKVIPTGEFTGIVKARISAFQERINAKKAISVVNSCKYPPRSEGKVVFYFTSLRGVRKTYEDCCSVRVILRGYGVRVDERDVSMHGGFKEELNHLLRGDGGGRRLPRVFANGKYLGGAEELRQMHDAGELSEVLADCEELSVGKGGGGGGVAGGACEGCGDVRFVPCDTCSGSCKVFVIVGEDEREEEEGIETGGFRRCPDCNENGLVRCPVCCSS